MQLTFELTAEQREALLQEARNSKEFEDAVEAGVASVVSGTLALLLRRQGQMVMNVWAGVGDLQGWSKDFPIESAVDLEIEERTHGGYCPDEVDKLRFFRAEFLRFAEKISKVIGD